MCLPDELARAWVGGDGEDYNRACAVRGDTGLIAVGDGQAIVLGYPNSTTWIEAGKNVGLITQAIISNSDEQVLALALETASGGGWRPIGKLDVGSGKLRIQDACSSGKKPANGKVVFQVPHGRYVVEHRRTGTMAAEISAVRLRRTRKKQCRSDKSRSVQVHVGPRRRPRRRGSSTITPTSTIASTTRNLGTVRTKQKACSASRNSTSIVAPSKSSRGR